MAGCASRPIAHVSPEVIAVPVQDTPPADLLACPQPARAFPTDTAAVLPKALRGPLQGLAIEYRDLFDRQVRLINWISPGACAVREAAAR
ncbi:hypothetical protein OMP43_03900 [Sphingomonas sp. CBMAI 2297]|uniref:hypothetical protein n=1 Tax=Sphingomonas sp. CBMAI 2297 TaxID=2991720 RepID=UPI0024555F8F|nr:hypothetical protein [Sphingomonas sp. CBMAI 2297]MDH4743158.1 hypothetical protein [Sphingomonas sp. CBMAI 2297]